MKTVHFIAIQLLILTALIVYIQVKTKNAGDSGTDAGTVEKIDSLETKIQGVSDIAKKQAESMLAKKSAEDKALENRLKNYAISRINEYSKLKMNEISPFFGKDCYVIPDSTHFNPASRVSETEFTAGWTISKKIINDLFPEKNIEEKHASFRGKCMVMEDFSCQFTLLSQNEEYIAAEANKNRILKVSEILLLIKNIAVALNDNSATQYSIQ